MSLSGQFFAPLTGRTTTFLLNGREDNIVFASVVTSLLAQSHAPCAILDLDAFYSSNSDRIFPVMDATTARSTMIWVPRPGSDVELDLSALFDVPQGVVIIDSLNSLYHLISLEDVGSRGKKLTFALASLSYFARTNSKAVILTMYRREGFYRAGTGRSISGLSDGTASVTVIRGELKIRSERGPGWPGGEFSTRIPSVSPSLSR